MSRRIKYSALPVVMQRTRSELERVSSMSAETEVDDVGTACRVLGKYVCYVDPDDQSVAQNVMRDGYWEAWITLAWLRELDVGMTVLDIGANCGYFSLIAADAVGPRGHVTAFEPQPRLADWLRQSFLVNGFRNAEVRGEAISDAAGTVPLYVVDGLIGSTSLFAPEGYQTHTVEVPTITLDSLGLSPDLIKIDAEGAEEKIWHGMQATLDANPDAVVMMEVDSRRYDDPDAFFSSINDRFPLRMISFDGEIVPFRTGDDLDMLYLSNR